MNIALKQVINNDDDQPKQTAVIIPIEKITTKRSRKKSISPNKETEPPVAAPLPGFTLPVFKPRKHDLL